MLGGWRSVTVTPPEWPMTGRNVGLFARLGPSKRWSWCILKGGSGVLDRNFPVRLIEDHGGVTLTNKMVQGLIVENGKCVGVECADGSSYRAEKAVLSTIHIKHLIDMAPRKLWAEDFVSTAWKPTRASRRCSCSITPRLSR